MRGPDQYEIQEQLWADAQGTAYRALDRNTREPVELRILRTDDDVLWPHIQRRCRLSVLVDSPFVRRVRALDLEGDRPFVVLEPAPARTLDEVIGAHRPLPIEESARWLAAVAAPLVAAHRVGLSHCGLSSRNVGCPVPIEAGQFVCSLDLTRCPESLRADGAVDVAQLAELWSWMLSAPVTDVADAPADLKQLFQEMDSSEPGDRPSAESVAGSLQNWLRRSAPRAVAESLASQANAPPQGVDSKAGVMQTVIGATDDFAREGNATVDVSGAAIEHRPRLDGQAQRSGPTDPLAGRNTLGRFRLLAKLGEGGMGAVWRAEDPLDGRTVAIKVLRSDLAQNETLRKRFQREARLLTEVNNPHVANMLEVNAEGDVHYFVLEFVDGENLFQFLKARGRLSEREAAAITADVARALRDAHERGIVHRDLKPENVLVCRDGGAPSNVRAPEFPRVKLTDFGLARHVDETESMHLTNAGTVLGTPLYFAPEQCSGKAEVDVRADVYSLGATLFHALVGRPPFEAANLVGLISKHVNEPAPRVRTLIPELSEAIDEIVAKCLQKSPISRYQNAGELLRDLERLLRGEPTSIVAHPQLPAGNSREVLAFDFSWELKNPPAALWPHVSNTERLNRAIGLSAVEFSTVPNPDGGSNRFAQFRRMGMKIAWQEHPFEWIEGRRMGVLREFTQGPWKWFTSVVEMLPRSDGGTTLVHRIRILPANLLGQMAARLEVGVRSGAALEKVYRHIDQALSGELGALADPFEDARDLSSTGDLKLEQRLQAVAARGGAPFVVDRLGEFLATAPLQELARIRPLALARRLSLDENQLLTACLIGAREGLFTLLWDIICPICRIPSQVKDSLKAIQEHGQCEACQSDFKLDFANSIELIFRIAPDIAACETGMYCIGGPAHSPHVVAQVRLAPGERFELDLALTEGAYRLRGPQLPYLFDFRVLLDAHATRCELMLARGPVPELPRQLKPGQQLFVLVNDTQHEVVVRVERTASRGDACTAARAAATPLFRELFPGECLAPEQLIQMAQVTLLFTRLEPAPVRKELKDTAAFARLHDHFRTLDAIVRHEGGSLIKTVWEGACFVFTDPVMAIRAALAMRNLDEPRLRIAVHRGSAIVATINEHLDYFGSTVSTTAHLLDAPSADVATPRPRIILSSAVAGDPQVVSAVTEAAERLNTKPRFVSLSHSEIDVDAYELELAGPVAANVAQPAPPP